MNTGFLGRDGFVWFVGVIEDRHDPEKLGRVKVRALGYHTDDKELIKTADLPWAEVMQPAGGNAMSGIGDSPIGIVEGSWVVGFFRDPESLQEPIIMGTLPGKNTRVATQMKAHGPARGTDNQFGFYDPTTVSSDLPYESDDTTYRPSGGSGSDVTKIAEVPDLRIRTYTEINKPPKKLKTATSTVGTHSQGLFDTFGTTRRLTIEAAVDSGKSYGDASITSDWEKDREESPTGTAAENKAGKIVSTGYLEKDTRGSTGAYWPLIAEKAAADRTPYPRLDTILKSALTTVQEKYIRGLFEDGVYGFKSKGGGKFFDDLSASESIILPRNDTGRLAQAGATITSVSATGESISLSYKVKPNVGKDDKVQFAGIVGMETMNGQTFTLKSASLGATSGTVTISAPGDKPLGKYIRGGAMLVDPHPVLANKTDTRERQINIGGPDLTGEYTGFWNQPTSRYAAVYPYNHVYESESGHMKEFDDTPGAERIHEYHRAGTFYEIDPEGTKVDYVKGDNYNIRVHDDYLYVKGHVVWTGDNDMLIASNEKMGLSSKWRLSISAGGDVEIYSKRNLNFRAEGDINMLAGGNISLEAEVTTDQHDNYKTPAGSRAKETISNINLLSGTVTTKAGDGNISMFTTKGDISIATENPSSGGHISVYSKKGQIRVKAPDDNISLYTSSGEVHEQGANIYMNSGKATPDSPEEPTIDLLTITQNADSVTTGITGQGAGLGIDTVGDNIRKLRK